MGGGCSVIDFNFPMKSASPFFPALVLAGAALLFAGCPKKPARPSPNETQIGQGNNMNQGASDSLGKPSDADQGLTARNGLGDASQGQRGVIESIYFGYDRSDIAPAARANLQKAKQYLEQNASARLLLEGHCDWRGTAEYNLSLGDRRANAAKKYLIGLGVSADKLDTLSKGSEEATKNADKATAAKDRRVEFVVLGMGAGAAPAPAGGAPMSSPTPMGANPPPATP